MNLVTVALFSLLIIVGAVWVVVLKDLFRAALSLGVVLLGIAGMFILLQAEFVAFVQVLIYVGAVLTLVVFAIMLTGKSAAAAGDSRGIRKLPAAVVSLILFVVLVGAVESIGYSSMGKAAPVRLNALGEQLVGPLVLPFEVITIVLVSALVGAVVIAYRRFPSSTLPRRHE